jgi:hypothetical protein
VEQVQRPDIDSAAGHIHAARSLGCYLHAIEDLLYIAALGTRFARRGRRPGAKGLYRS